MPMEHARCLHLLVEISKRQPEMEESVTYEAKLAANELIYKYLTTHDGTNLPEYNDSVSRHTRPTRVEIGLAQIDLEKAVEDNIFCFWR